MSDPAIRELIKNHLCQGKVVVSRDSELREAIGLGCTKNVANRAMGRLVADGEVIRTRRHPQCMYDDDRPITYRLKF